jgi:hypothetical protein
MPGIRPFLKLSYTLNWTSGLGVLGFHAVYLACHLAAVCCVYALGRAWQGWPTSTPVLTRRMALTTALLFALHPAQTEAVTYISGRSVSLMGLAYLGALLAYHYGRAHDCRIWHAGISPLLFLTALAVKETAWTLPLALLLWDAGTGSLTFRTRLRRIRIHTTILALSAGVMLCTTGYQRLLLGSLETRTLWENLLTQIDGQSYLLAHPLLCLQTNIDPDLAIHTRLDASLLLSGGFLTTLLLVGAWQLRTRVWLGVGILWTFLHLLPTNSALPRLDVANDRQLYLALIGPALLVAVGLWNSLARPQAVAATCALVLILGGATARRNLDYRSESALWETTTHTSPMKARVWNNLGYAAQLAGDTMTACSAYHHALWLDPETPKARANLALLSPSCTAQTPPVPHAKSTNQPSHPAATAGPE